MVFDWEHYVANVLDFAVYLVNMLQLSTKAFHPELELLGPLHYPEPKSHCLDDGKNTYRWVGMIMGVSESIATDAVHTVIMCSMNVDIAMPVECIQGRSCHGLWENHLFCKPQKKNGPPITSSEDITDEGVQDWQLCSTDRLLPNLQYGIGETWINKI
jgi:hypothetical protein